MNNKELEEVLEAHASDMARITKSENEAYASLEEFAKKLDPESSGILRDYIEVFRKLDNSKTELNNQLNGKLITEITRTNDNQTEVLKEGLPTEGIFK